MITANEAKNLTLTGQGYDVEKWYKENEQKISMWVTEEAKKGNSSLIITNENCSRIGFEMDEYVYFFKIKEELDKLGYYVDTRKYDKNSAVSISW